MILGLRTCIYLVKDITGAKKWYSKAFKCAPYFDEAFYVGFNIHGYELGLQPQSEVRQIKQDSVLTYWGVDQIEIEYNRFIELGATAHGAPENVGGEIFVATVLDPWGNVIGLIYNPHFKLST